MPISLSIVKRRAATSPEARNRSSDSTETTVELKDDYVLGFIICEIFTVITLRDLVGWETVFLPYFWGIHGERTVTAISSKTKGPGEQGAAGYCPKILLPKRAKMVFCSLHRSHGEICTRNVPLSETKFLDDFWGPLSLPAPLFTVDSQHLEARPELQDWLRFDLFTVKNYRTGPFPK